MYLKFEMDNENLAEAEKVRVLAIQACPWAKVSWSCDLLVYAALLTLRSFCLQMIYLKAASCFPQRTQELVELMTERELRIFTPFEEADLFIKSKET